jgi:hypothetical protein
VVQQAPPTVVPAAQSAPDPVPVGSVIGTVVDRKDGALVLATDLSSQLEVGMAVGFNDERGDEFAVGRISKLNARTVHVAVGINEEVPEGTVGYRSTHAPSGSLEGPPPGAYPLAVALVLRPWLGLNGQESGVLIDASVRVRLGEKAKLTFALEPAAPSFGSIAGAIETYVAPSISMRLAEIGFGIGVGSALGEGRTTPEYGLLFSPILRLGAEDGLYFRARSSAVLSSGIASFGSLRCEGQIPLTYGLWLLLGGGAGTRSYGYGELGLRLLMSGAGSRHSWFAKVLIGGAGAVAPVVESGFVTYTSQAGPTFGIGLEGRL